MCAKTTAYRQSGRRPATCFYHLHRLRQIRRRVGTEVTIRLVLAVVMSRVDYCNSTLAAGLSQSTLAPLQRVQNAAARLHGLRARIKRTRHSKSTPAALASSTLARPI